MRYKNLSKHPFMLLGGVLSIVALLGCNLIAPRAYDADIASTVAVLETELARQATQVTTLSEGLSYLSTRVGALPASTPTSGFPTRTPPPSRLPAPTNTLTPVSSFPSPDGLRRAVIQDRGIVIIQGAEEQRGDLLVAGAVSSLAWFPDGKHIAYSEHDTLQDIVARRDTLWIVNVETEVSWQIGTGHTPHISPDGRHIAVLDGVLWGDACFVGYDIAVFELDDTLQVAATYHQDEFAGLPGAEDEETEGASFYPVSTEGIKAPGVWQTDTQLLVGLSWACSALDDQDNGIYLLDLTTLQAHKTADLTSNDL